MAKILVLATYDTKLPGHGYVQAERYRKEGHEVCFVVLYKKEKAPVKCIFDNVKNKYSPKRLAYILVNIFLRVVLLAPKDNIHCFCSSYLLGISAKSILKKCPFNPDYICINWVPDFLTAKTVNNLYKLTQAKIHISMIDEAVLSLCHYHCDCEQFYSGCRNCPKVRGKWIPRFVMAQRKKYWTDIPMSIEGVNNDIEIAKGIDYFNNKNFYPSVDIPNIPLVITKAKAREILDLSENDYILFAGAHYLYEKRKGFDVLAESLNIFSKKYNLSSKKVTLLLVGYGSKNFAKRINGINVISKDFIKGDDFYYAYYACDVYASPTLADSGPMMVNFAIACNRPVVAFPVGSAKDLVVSKETGYMANYGDAEDFAYGIELFYNRNEEELNIIGKKCIQRLLYFKKINHKFIIH